MKYHQYGVAPEYEKEKNGMVMLSNNWNPDLDYKNEYSNVHFKIDKNGYGYPDFNFHGDDGKKFYAEVRSLLEPLGWENKDPENDWYCGFIHKGKGELYLHPQDFSGVIPKNDIGVLGTIFEKAKTFECRWAELHETYYDISDEVYQKYLDGKRNEIKKIIFVEAATKRRNLYHREFEFIMGVTQEVQLYRVGKVNTTLANTESQTMKFVGNLVDEMVEDGFLKKVEKQNDAYIRSINKTEQREMKLKPIFA